MLVLKRLSLALVFLAGALMAPGGAFAFNLDSLLVVSVGGKAAVKQLAQVKYYSAAGTVDLYGQPGKFTEYFQPPDKLYLALEFEGYSVTQGYDGKVAWQSDLNGRITEMTGFEKRELVKTIYFESCSFLFTDRLPGDKRYEGIVTHGDSTYHQVAFVPVEGDTVRVLFDTSTGRPQFRISNLDNTRTVTSNEDFRRVNEVLLPFYSVTKGVDVPITAEFRTTDISFARPFNDSVFSMPGHENVDYHFPADSASVTVPFEYRGGHIYVTARVNGVRKGTFILDSGCSATIFDSGFLAGLKLAPSGSMPAKGVGGFESVELLRSDSIEIGSIALYRLICGTSDLSSIGRGDTLVFGGILGYDVLSRFPVQIDYRARTLTFFNPSTFTLPSGGTEIPFTLTMQVPTVRGSILGAEGEFIIDLGNAYGLLIHESFARSNDLARRLAVDSANAREFAGVGGGVSGARTVLDTFRLGAFMMKDLPTILSDASTGMTGSEAIAGNIGNEVLQRYRIILDYQHQRLVFY